jgi:polyhydroxybutyrate depolymerase
MKKRLLPFAMLFLINHFALAQTDTYDSIYFGGRWRTYMTELPTGYNSSINYPLVLAFHGGGSPGYQTLQYQSRLSLKGDTAGFIVVYPEGVKVAGSRTWNGGNCCSPATTLNIDDVGFVDDLLDSLFITWSIDQSRVYATGFSNGAILCYRLANQLPNRFAAIAPVEGDLMYYPWTPSKSTPIISFHSYLDMNIPYFGGSTVGPSGSYYPPQDSMFTVIGTNYSCTHLKDTLYHNTNEYDHFMYSSCSDNSLIEQYVSYDGEHSWPGGLSISSKPVSTQFSATYLMWKFFQNYTIASGTTSLFPIDGNRNKLSLFPNPTSNTVVLDLSSDYFTISVFNNAGIKVKEYLLATGKYEIDCSGLSEGLYFIQVENEKEIVRGKFVKE